MRRAKGLVEWSRRDFCTFATLGLAAAACTDGNVLPIQTGPLGGPDDEPDAGTPGDSGTNPDAPNAPVCSGTPTDVGPPAMFTLNTPVFFTSPKKFFVVRDSGGVYALTSACTHEGVTCNVSGQNFRCPRHGAIFTFNGAVVSGPVSHPLVHYAMCTMPNGNLGVTTATTVSATTRLVV